MPPPPVDYQTKTKAASVKSTPPPSHTGSRTDGRAAGLSPKAAGKRKAQEVIEILDDDDDDVGGLSDDIVKLGSTLTTTSGLFLPDRASSADLGGRLCSDHRSERYRREVRALELIRMPG